MTLWSVVTLSQVSGAVPRSATLGKNYQSVLVDSDLPGAGSAAINRAPAPSDGITEGF